jgi:hypothetical protein
MRKPGLTQFALAVLAASPLLAQGSDPTNKITGSGTLPTGWVLRFDPSRPGRPAPAMTDVNFVTMGPGLHVTSGPAAIYYRTADVAKGEYAVSASFAQRKSLQHEAYGLFIGGSNLQDSTQSYTYFVVRPMDGAILINHRDGNAKPKQIVAWTPDAAVNKEDATDGHATNALTIHVAKDSVHFLANGKLVKALAKSELGGSTEGVAGMRINHNIDVHVADFKVAK